MSDERNKPTVAFWLTVIVLLLAVYGGAYLALMRAPYNYFDVAFTNVGTAFRFQRVPRYRIIGSVGDTLFLPAHWLTVVVVGVPLLYVLSFGPACWLVQRYSHGDWKVATVGYRPLFRMVASESAAGVVLQWWGQAWVGEKRFDDLRIIHRWEDAEFMQRYEVE